MPHIHEKIDFAADVYIVHSGRVLLRKHDKYKMWLPPGGHIELDEDPNQAAIREVKEEVGLDITIVPQMSLRLFEDATDIIPPRFMNRHRVNDTHEHIMFIYFATTKNTNIKQSKTEISDDIRWLSETDLEDVGLGIPDRTKYYARAALKTLS